MTMSEEFTRRLSRMRWYAKQYWKLKKQHDQMSAEASYEEYLSDGDADESWYGYYYMEKFSRLMTYCKGKTSQEMIELSKPINYGGTNDINDLRFPPEITDYACKD